MFNRFVEVEYWRSNLHSAMPEVLKEHTDKRGLCIYISVDNVWYDDKIAVGQVTNFLCPFKERNPIGNWLATFPCAESPVVDRKRLAHFNRYPELVRMRERNESMPAVDRGKSRAPWRYRQAVVMDHSLCAL